MNTHKLKILPEYFKAVQESKKTFELREFDRDYKVGDRLILREWIKKDLQRESNFTGQEIEKEISYILTGGKYGLEEGYCILGLKEEGIRLKNIDLTGISKEEQWEKMSEEESEFVEAFFCYENNKNEIDKKHVIEEFFDVIQAALGVLEKEGITAEEVQAYYPQHISKIKNRPRRK